MITVATFEVLIVANLNRNPGFKGNEIILRKR